jgi:hypothetical protein
MAVKTTTATKSSGFTDEERAAMKERAKELKAEARKADGEKTLLAKIAEMPKSDRAMAKRLHDNEEGKVVCFFRGADKFKDRYATFGFNDAANLDKGNMWPTSFALTKLTGAEEKKIRALVKKAVA